MATFISLTQYELIEILGEDAEKYLQGQLTCDVVNLQKDNSTITAHCDPKGKVTSILRLIKVSSEHFLLLMPKGLSSALNALKKYAVFSKVTFQTLNWQIIGAIGKNLPQTKAQIVLNIGERTLLLNPSPLDILCDGDEKQWKAIDIKSGIPTMSEIIQNEFIPQALNLQAIEQAISFRKGCYIGQEIVARAKYRGANKRAMYVLSGKTSTEAEIGAEIEMQLENNWRKTGTIVNTLNFENVLWLQVVMNNDLDDKTQFRLPQDKTQLDIFPLPYSLIN